MSDVSTSLLRTEHSYLICWEVNVSRVENAVVVRVRHTCVYRHQIRVTNLSRARRVAPGKRTLGKQPCGGKAVEFVLRRRHVRRARVAAKDGGRFRVSFGRQTALIVVCWRHDKTMRLHDKTIDSWTRRIELRWRWFWARDEAVPALDCEPGGGSTSCSGRARPHAAQR